MSKKSDRLKPDCLEDAADTAAYKLTVVMSLINENRDNADDGGYNISIARELLDSIRADLRASVAAARAEHKLRLAGGA